MAKYMLRRLVELVITVFLIATATFFLLEAVPGDALGAVGLAGEGVEQLVHLGIAVVAHHGAIGVGIPFGASAELYITYIEGRGN